MSGWVMRIAGLTRLEVGELCGHRLAEDQSTRMPCQGHTGRIARRPECLIERRAVPRGHVRRVDDVLDADGDPLQGTGAELVQVPRHLQGSIHVKMLPCLYERLALTNAVQASADQSLAGEATITNALRGFKGSETSCHLHQSSMIRL